MSCSVVCYSIVLVLVQFSTAEYTSSIIKVSFLFNTLGILCLDDWGRNTQVHLIIPSLHMLIIRTCKNVLKRNFMKAATDRETKTEFILKTSC